MSIIIRRRMAAWPSVDDAEPRQTIPTATSIYPTSVRSFVRTSGWTLSCERAGSKAHDFSVPGEPVA
jgi:hypothetical protein